MKNERVLALALGLLGALGCSTPSAPPASARRAHEVGGAADGLRVDHEYRPPPTGSDVHVAAYEHPPRAYFATCWDSRYARCRPFRRCD